MPFDGILIHTLIAEIRPQLLERKVEKISQPNRDTVRIGFRNAALFLSIDASMSYFTLTETAFENPAEPPMFTMLLRKHLSGSILSDIKQYGLDRITKFSFRGFDALGDPTIKHIVIENMGRHSNLFLLDEDDRIIDAIKRVSLDESKDRLLLPVSKYKPPASEKKDIREASSISPSIGVREFVGEFQGFSSVSASYYLELLEACGQTEATARILQVNSPGIRIDANQISKDFYHIGDAFGIYGAQSRIGERVETQNSVASMVDRFYSRAIKELKMHQSLSSLKKQIQTRLERLRSKRIKLEQELTETARADEWKRSGQLLTANLYRIAPGSSRVTLEDYSTGEARTLEIKLDTRMSPTENAQSHFKKYRKLQSGAVNIREQIAIAVEDIQYLENTLNLLEHTEDASGSEEIRRELQEAGLIRQRTNAKTKSKQKTKSKLPTFHRFRSSDGLEILVGKSNVGNDHLSLKYADRQDIWLHTKDIPSAHVILRCAHLQDEPPLRSIDEAAMICVMYSRAKHSNRIAVDYCRAKFVKKPPGSRPGMVIYTDHKTRIATPDPAHIEEMRQ